MTEGHFGCCKVDCGCEIIFYHLDKRGDTRREIITIIKDYIEANVLCAKLNEILPVIKKTLCQN